MDAGPVLPLLAGMVKCCEVINAHKLISDLITASTAAGQKYLCFTSLEGLETQLRFQKSLLMSLRIDAKVHPSTSGRRLTRGGSESAETGCFCL